MRRPGWVVASVCLALLGTATVLAILNGDALARNFASFGIAGAILGLTFSIVGAVIVQRHPWHRLGWVFLAVGGLEALSVAAHEYGRFGLLTLPGSLPGATFASWVHSWVWEPAQGLLLVFLFLLFPDGHLPSRRWRPVAVIAAAAIAAITMARAVASWPVRGVPLFQGVQAADAMPAAVADRVETVFTVVLLAMLASVSSLAVRFRRADRAQRRQIAWFVYGAVLSMIILLGSATWLGEPHPLSWLLPSVIIPTCTGIAILRYRLFEIDRIVSRTVSYALVTTILLAVYALVAVLPSAMFRMESDLLVAAATLVATAAFVPVRRHVQTAVDRRFNRERYNAARVTQRFAVRMRVGHDLDVLADDLRGSVARSMQPSHVWLWLKPGAGP